jgi:hypothetical protein
MREFAVVLFGALIGGAFSLATAFLYIRVVRRVARRVFRSWFGLLWLPIHVVFACTLVAAFIFPYYMLGVIGTAFPLPDALYALTLTLSLAAALPALIYFFRQWNNLQKHGYIPRPKA